MISRQCSSRSAKAQKTIIKALMLGQNPKKKPTNNVVIMEIIVNLINLKENSKEVISCALSYMFSALHKMLAIRATPTTEHIGS